MRPFSKSRADYLGLGGVAQVTAHLRGTLLSALRDAGCGHFELSYETHRLGKFRVFVDGTICQRFFLAAEEVSMRLQQIGKRAPAQASTVEEVLTQVERTLLSALEAGGFGHFAIRYERRTDARFEIVIDGTEQRAYLVPAEEVTALMNRAAPRR